MYSNFPLNRKTIKAEGWGWNNIQNNRRQNHYTRIDFEMESKSFSFSSKSNVNRETKDLLLCVRGELTLRKKLHYGDGVFEDISF